VTSRFQYQYRKEGHSHICPVYFFYASKGLNYVWEMLDPIMPLLKPSDGKEPLVKWEGYLGLNQGSTWVAWK